MHLLCASAQCACTVQMPTFMCTVVYLYLVSMNLTDEILWALPELNALNGEEPYAPPTELLLVPAGDFTGRDGTPYKNSKPNKIVALFKKEGIALAIDFDHSIYYNGGGAACGWIKKLEVRDGAIWGSEIEWLDRARWALEEKTYKYYSPHYVVDRASREIVRLDVVSLVNRPRLSVQALNAMETQEHNQKEYGMNLQDELNAALKNNLQLAQQVSEAESKANQLQSEVNALKAEKEQLAAKLKEREEKEAAASSAAFQGELNGFLDEQVKAGKMPPAQKEFCLKTVRNEDELNGLKELWKDAKKILPDDKNTGAGASLDSELNALGLDEEELQLAKSMGLEPADLKK